MSEHGEGPREPIIGAQNPQTGSQEFQEAANRASDTLHNRDLNPKSPSLKQKLAGGLAALGIAFGGGVAASDKVQETVSDVAGTVRDVGEAGVNVAKAPYEIAKDAAQVLSPESNPDKPKNPDKIMVGTISIETSDDLKVRTSPNISGKESAGNTLDWGSVKLVNKEVRDGKVELVPVDFKPGDTLIIENPELVAGQNADGGFNAEKEANWIMLYTQNDKEELKAVYISRQQTFPYVKTTSENNQYIDVKTSDSDGGALITTYSGEKPPIVNHISVEPSRPAVSSTP